MDKRRLEELFYSDEMEGIRLNYYRQAYRQGKIDQIVENTYHLNDYISKIEPFHLQSEEYQKSSVEALYDDDDE
ncbi:hypothetical protein G9G63_08960 [Paenibacillus sp. EKM202P]|uniref:hypothetical protein n=1 Tax=unclassified Paenibacillus TaxID=185978 RepID=UPI0013ED977C|nr:MULTISPECIES: hypothetical protein [unclassified Paenibacillus]KAF6565280.1 hypothetical protein G9G63_08960 [Paenibacillus sp. EKM202P]KAF6569394.1 hypothetical protein G9G64_13130 [Paenibacillus sp. EKM207P]